MRGKAHTTTQRRPAWRHEQESELKTRSHSDDNLHKQKPFHRHYLYALSEGKSLITTVEGKKCHRSTSGGVKVPLSKTLSGPGFGYFWSLTLPHEVLPDYQSF